MNTKEQIEWLAEAELEIKSLRRSNELLRAKVEVMDLFACVLFTNPSQRLETAAPDVAWKLREFKEYLEEKEKAKPQVVPGASEEKDSF